MANSDMLVRIKANTDNYNAGIAKARRTLDGFKQDNLTLGGIINQSTKSLVAAAAQYASFAAVIGTVASGFAEATSKGIAMAREAEGVSKAFERLNKPGLLDNLREATHNTVNDLELMKQAVKFDNFNLSLDQMGTMLAFAQQQAKDTGQDVGYLVDSIVTGLGRKSLPILDNLGLSATEIRERMKETGDMTKAVADIIQERMKNAGDYVETAANRAAQAQTRLENAMMELGNTFGPITESSDSLWNSIKVGAINALSYVGNLINYLHEAGRISKTIGNMNGGGMMERFGNNLRNSKDPSTLYSRQLAAINRSINAAEAKLQQAEKGGMGSIQIYRERVQALKEVKKQYEDLYKTISSPAKNPLIASDTDKKKTKKGGGKTEVVYAEGSIAAQAKLVSDLTKKWNEAGENMRTGYLFQLVEAEKKLKGMKDQQQAVKDMLMNGPAKAASPIGLADVMTKSMKEIEEELAKNPIKLNIEIDPEKIKSIKSMAALQKTASDTAKVVGSIGEAFNAIEDPAAKVAGTVAQAIANIALGYSQAMLTPKDPISWIAFGATGLAQMLTMISAIHSSTGYANGGMVKGNSYSGDNIPAMIDGGAGGFAGLNAGEIVLNKAAQGNLASQLQGAGFGGVNMVGEISGEAIKIVLNRHLKRTGQGEIVTW
jgi:hypothetical protein